MNWKKFDEQAKTFALKVANMSREFNYELPAFEIINFLFNEINEPKRITILRTKILIKFINIRVVFDFKRNKLAIYFGKSSYIVFVASSYDVYVDILFHIDDVPFGNKLFEKSSDGFCLFGFASDAERILQNFEVIKRGWQLRNVN